MNRIVKVLSPFAFSLLVWSSVAVVRAEAVDADPGCGKSAVQGISYSYCVSKSKNENSDIVYFLHGLNGSEQEGMRLAKSLAPFWESSNKSAPTFVSISFGNMWVIAPKQGSEKPTQLLNIVVQNFIPQIEAQIGGLKGRRLLAGLSLGGFNASQLLMWYPTLFSRVALLCPAIPEISPFSSLSEVQDFIRKQKANPFKVFEAQAMARQTFKTRENWDAISPLNQGGEVMNATYPALYVSVGEQDDYGFYPGARDFVDLAKSKGLDARWYSVPGPHCSFDKAALANFLVE